MNTLKLNKINNSPLTKEQMQQVVGGGPRICGCGCCFTGTGGSSVASNRDANWGSGQYGWAGSPCDIQEWKLTNYED